MSGIKTRWSGESDEAHPEIFQSIPPQPEVLKPGQVSKEKVEQFFDEGFLVIEDFFTPNELNPAINAIEDLVDDLAQKLYNAGKIKDLYKDYSYLQRLTMIDNEFPGANIILHKLASLPQAFCDIWANTKLLNLAEQLLGTADLAGNPNWNIRVKVPKEDAATVPWHQDSAYLDNESYSSFLLSAWIPLMNADSDNGCLEMMRYAHKPGKIAKHVGCWRDTWYIMLEDEEMRQTLGCDLEKDVVSCPVSLGGVLLFNNFIPHRSTDNTTNRIRWSLDFRWHEVGKPTGFYGLKETVRMRSSTDDHFEIDWKSFNEKEAEFDTTIPGPWMKKWEIVHHNRHTAVMAKIEKDAGTLHQNA
jgi:hypothetical protein